MKKITLRIVPFCSPDRQNLLPQRIDELTRAGFDVRYDQLHKDDEWPFTTASIKARTKALSKALTEKSTHFVLAVRGGYGASDLLPLISWPTLKSSKSILVGFSDVCVLHCALYAKFKKIGLHAPMPSSTLWNKDGVTWDVDQLKEIMLGKRDHTEISAHPLSKTKKIQGKLFGGNLAALTNLIGTPYFPKSLKDHILFFEDIDENGGRVARYLNQWIQSGVLKGVRGIVWGSFLKLGQGFPDNSREVYKELQSRVPSIPCFYSNDFGHLSPNVPLPIGGFATIDKNKMTSVMPRFVK